MSKATIQKLLLDNRAELVRTISLTSSLWDHLLQARIVTNTEKQEIEVRIYNYVEHFVKALSSPV